MACTNGRPRAAAGAELHPPTAGTNRALGLALVLTALLVVLRPAASLATPTPPVILVNHAAAQCSQVIQGDDCSWCEPPSGWEVLGRAGEAMCPPEYAVVGAPAMNCRRYEIPFCCSGGVHRDDCEDMILNHDAATCGFVGEIKGCALPENWQARPAGVEPRDWSCPAGYSWQQAEIACLSAAAGTPEATAPAPGEDEEATRRGICFGLGCLILAALLFGAAAMFPAWYVVRQKERRTLPPSSRH